MPNIHGLHDNNNAADESSDDDNNDRYVGGVDARGGGSGLAVVPNRDNANDARGASDSIFNLAENAGNTAAAAAAAGASGGGGGEVRRTITMYRSGFTVDNGPYRQLNDPNNAEFLTSLSRGMIPRELSQEVRENSEGGGNPEVMVGLVDKRAQEYDPERHGKQGGADGGGGGFQSFSGEGQSLAASAPAASSSSGGVINPTNATSPQTLDASKPTTSIAIRLLNGKRLVVKVNLDAPVSELGQHIGSQAGMDPYSLTSGYPPARIDDLGKSVEEAGLKGAQVVLKKA
eukprot:CAMPEP_0172318670 /NCGR_PEP_ID=MMETSP1058-20130122/35509_1 /TAXON_ID=83371 /ORGANISM="Detonula confervacea, Strain CCMP 353" /LENGTH=287 /DNA_ID=CAMNT_0013033551 /DNA_START=16 /DNA_END=879 /DNA_ORIENTATION=+